MEPVSDFIREEHARRRARGRRVARILALWLMLVVIALICANVREYRALKTPMPVGVVHVGDSVADATAWEAGYRHWLDTVDNDQWAR